MQVDTIIQLINTITNDAGNVTYPLSEVILAINDAQRLICNYRPDACSSTNNFSLASGSRQLIPAGSRRVLGVSRNMGVDGLTPGSYINQTTIKELNLFDPNWHTEAGSKVLSWAYDESRPEEFFIYPNVTPTFYIELKTADNPVDITSEASTISIADVYAPCIVSWSCYRLFSRDGAESPNYARAETHKQTVYEILGLKSQSDAQVSPNNE